MRDGFSCNGFARRSVLFEYLGGPRILDRLPRLGYLELCVSSTLLILHMMLPRPYYFCSLTLRRLGLGPRATTLGTYLLDPAGYLLYRRCTNL